jgi:hypothetical protein
MAAKKVPWRRIALDPVQAGENAEVVMNRQAEQPKDVPNEVDASEQAPSVDLGRVRELILAANPDVIPELIAGDSFDALMGSVDSAKQAYQNVATRFQQQGQGQRQPTAASVPAGLSSSMLITNCRPGCPAAKIAEGLRRRNAKR